MTTHSTRVPPASRRDTRTPALITLLLCATLTVMAGATIAPSLPGLQNHFAGIERSATIVPLILTVPGLAIALCSPLTGYLADRFAKRPILIGSITLYIIAGSSGLYLDTLGEILIGRALLGIAVSGIMTTAVSLIAGLYSNAERGRVLGFQSAAMGFGGVVFIMTGGFLADLSWRGPFAIYLAPLFLVPAVLIFAPRGEPETARVTKSIKDHRFPYAWSAIIYMGVFVSFLVFYTIPLKLPFLLRDLGVESAAVAGSAIALWTFSSGVASLFYGRIRRLGPPRLIAAIAFAVLGLGFAYLATVPPVSMIFAMMIFVGIASGIIMPNATTWLYSKIEPDMQGRAAGYTVMSVFSAQFLSAPITATLLPMGGYSMVYGSASAAATGVAIFYAVRHLAKQRNGPGGY